MNLLSTEMVMPSHNSLEPFIAFPLFSLFLISEERSTISNFQLQKSQSSLALHFSLASFLIIRREMNHAPRWLPVRCLSVIGQKPNNTGCNRRQFLRLNTTGAIYRRTSRTLFHSVVAVCRVQLRTSDKWFFSTSSRLHRALTPINPLIDHLPAGLRVYVSYNGVILWFFGSLSLFSVCAAVSFWVLSFFFGVSDTAYKGNYFRFFLACCYYCSTNITLLPFLHIWWVRKKKKQCTIYYLMSLLQIVTF